MRDQADGAVPPITDALRALHDAGWLTFDGLAERVGLDPASHEFDDVVEGLLDEHGDRVELLAHGRLGDAVGLLASTALTRRLSAEEAEGGWLATDPDLTVFGELADESLPLAAGGRVAVTVDIDPMGLPSSRLVGPPGWLAGAGEGSLVALELRDALVHVRVDSPVVDAGPAAAALAAGADRGRELAAAVEEDPVVQLGVALWEALALDPEPLRGVLPPLSELAEQAGWSCRGEVLRPPGEAWPEPRDPAEGGALLATAMYGLEAPDAAALADLRRARLAAGEAEPGEVLDADTLADAAAALRRPEAVVALAHERAPDDAAAAALARAVLATDPGSPGAHLLAARAADADGDLEACQTHLDTALDADPGFIPAVRAAADLAEDRGELERARQLLRRTGDPDDADRADELAACLPAAASVGRNDPCPCGSGRKAKKCCGGQPAIPPLAVRVDRLEDKLTRFCLDPEHRDRLRPLVAARLGGGVECGWHEDHAGDPVVLDIAAFDEGLLEEFLARRGPALPADERELAARWRDTRRSVHRVTAQRGECLTLDDLVTGETREVLGREAPPLTVGECLLGRVLPDGAGGHRLFWGPLRLGPHPPADPEALLAVGGERLAAAVATDRPRVTTTEGEPTVWCELAYALPEPAEPERVADVLAAAGLTVEEPGRLVETVEIDGASRIRGAVAVAGGRVEVTANSDRRADRLAARVAEALPEAVLVAERRRPLWQFFDDLHRFGRPTEEPEASADERAALAAFIREQEQRWVDEPVPALDGLTPRQAAADPAHRAQLEQLVAEAPTGVEGAFDADRLRALLGLEPPTA